MSNLELEIKNKTEYIEKIIESYLPKEDCKQKLILDAMNYSVNVGGKRLRPMLMLETFKLFGGDDDSINPFMAAIEFIHTYSLVHDDLPAMDNDMYRRGELTTHAKYGEGMGVLAGDALLNYAYEICSNAVNDAIDKISNTDNFSEEKDKLLYCVKAQGVLSKKAGIYGMVGGQTVDILNENKKLDIDTINYIHNLKTAALIEASMMIGAIMAGANEEQINKVECIANNIGLAFQIQDDILDVIGDQEKLGKPVLSDEKNQKTTYISLIGLEKSKEKVEELSKDALSKLKTLGDNDFLEKLIIKLINREK